MADEKTTPPAETTPDTIDPVVEVASTEPAPAPAPEPEPEPIYCAVSGRELREPTETGLHPEVTLMRAGFIAAAIASGRYGSGEAKQMIAHADAALLAAFKTPFVAG
jgi:hypothetical protein